jgi:hypothetical protein
MSALNKAIESFFTRCLAPGRSYNENPPRKIISSIEGEEVTLMYQDGTDCSASRAFSYIYQTVGKRDYFVITETGCASYMGDSNDSNPDIHVTRCDSLLSVWKELLKFCFHDPNSAGDVFLIYDPKIPVHQRCCKIYQIYKELCHDGISETLEKMIMEETELVQLLNAAKPYNPI